MNRNKVVGILPPVIVCALLNLILFFTVPDARLGSDVFWIAWTFTFPVNLLIAIFSFLYAFKKKDRRAEDQVIYTPLTRRVVLIAAAAYLVLGAIFMYCPIESVALLIILECVLTGAYLVVLYTVMFAMNRISDAQNYTKQKVQFIRLLQSDLESCFANVNDPELLATLTKLSEKIRFSDPMSHPALATSEAEIAAAVSEIVTNIKCGNIETLEVDIVRVNGMLDARNSRCKLLK